MLYASQDTLIVGGAPAWGVRGVAFAFYGVFFYAAPGLFTWPLYLIAFCWKFFVWRPHWLVATGETTILWSESFCCLLLKFTGQLRC